MTKTKKKFKVGDEVVTYLRHTSVGRIAVRGIIKEDVGSLGTYIVEVPAFNSKPSRFPTRTIKSVK